MMTDGLRLANQFFENPNQLQVMQMYENGMQYLNIWIFAKPESCFGQLLLGNLFQAINKINKK